MDIGFWYESTGDNVMLYYRKEEFDTLAGVLYMTGLSDEEIDRRVGLAVDQCVAKLKQEIPTAVPSDKVEVSIVFIGDKSELPDTVGRRIRLV